MSENRGKEKKPWIWKAAIVALPAGLGLSAAIAVWLKVSRGPENGMLGLDYAAAELNIANLRDAAGKADDLIGVRDFDTPEGQRRMRMVTSFISGSVGPNNLGYALASDSGVTRSGRIWKNYWIDSREEEGPGTVVVWAVYSDDDQSGSVAALLALSEWIRGREFEHRIRVAWVRDEESLLPVTSDLAERKVEIQLQVTDLGHGSQGVMLLGGETANESESAIYQFTGKEGVASGTDWKLTAAWESYEAQVRELCERVSELAGEKVVLAP
ncbi:hypothetical protein [Roseibacillus ishigakijimensis]|uniref:Uncharacterized protein n=1 Tax=Roseibacillus ishigakijimensis TaxID=454146 RepID=A0A934VKJ8_9BACT|nr:hypothetical protein [Roseibacillus ishigakijimensis]MBK1833719.1 hypothetical protein [Roseibacillus ishigakijimensis]